MLRQVVTREGIYSASLDGQTFPVWFPSTMIPSLPGRKLKWWHPEWCRVESGECTCEPPERPA